MSKLAMMILRMPDSDKPSRAAMVFTVAPWNSSSRHAIPLTRLWISGSVRFNGLLAVFSASMTMAPLCALRVR